MGASLARMSAKPTLNPKTLKCRSLPWQGLQSITEVRRALQSVQMSQKIQCLKDMLVLVLIDRGHTKSFLSSRSE